MSISSQAQLPETNSTEATPFHRAAFVTTHWSIVLASARNDTTRAHEALAHLCETYWYPLYAYVRRRGQNPHDAQDLTQEFFARLLQKDYLHAAAPDKGRFRTFLLVVLKRFLADEWDKARAQKRGGGQIFQSLDTEFAEHRYLSEAARDL